MDFDPHKTIPGLHFKNPPIVEAVIALSVCPLPDAALQSFQACQAEMRTLGYRDPEPMTQHQFEMRIESGVPQYNTQDSALGLKFLSEDGLHAVQFTKSVFVFSRLGRYDRWEQFRDEARRCWDIYFRAASVVVPTVAGVRYINKLFIPSGADFQEYVCAGPKFPDSISSSITEMFMRVGVPIVDPQGTFIHTQALLPPEREGFATLLLDNDFQFPVQGRSSSEIWELLELVRVIKDRYFVELTTNKMRETFDA